MASCLRNWRNVQQKLPSFRRASNASPPTHPLKTPVEEETLPYYKPENYYPVNIGDVYETRYQIVGKLGYGTYSTSWLCHDLQNRNYGVLKVTTSLPQFPAATDRELKVYEHLAKVHSTHPGQSLIRELYDSFYLHGPGGKHSCLVLQPMTMTLFDIMGPNPRPFDLPLLKMTVKRLLMALDFLHTEAGIIHTEDKTMLPDFAKAESIEPILLKKVDESHGIYESRRFRPPAEGKNYGLPVLCDFGEACIEKTQQPGLFVQPHIYRAPEVIFEMPWSSAIDIWNLACLIWDLFEGQHLFADIFDKEGGHDPFKHLARIVALIGPPPGEFVRRSETTEQCFGSSGAWIAHEEANIPSITLESLEWRLSTKEKESFIQFMRSMLRWLPEERRTAKQLLEDPWLLWCFAGH